MNFLKYQEEATTTFKPAQELGRDEARLLNWTLGIASEAGEVADLIKHGIFHREDIDPMKVAKEIGDILWYLAAMCDTMDIKMQDCAELNIAKLRHRHGQAFSFQGSHERHSREANFEETYEYLALKRRITHED